MNAERADTPDQFVTGGRRILGSTCVQTCRCTLTSALEASDLSDTRGRVLAAFPELEGKHAVVMGGAGFLGSHICTRLMYSGTRVTCSTT